MRYRITGQYRSLGTSVEPFIVDAEDEIAAQNQADKLGVEITSVELVSESVRPPESNPTNRTSDRRTTGIGMRTLFLGAVLGSIVGAVTAVAMTLLLQLLLEPAPSPDRDIQFQAISTAMKPRLE